jgi:hypothetical protein
MGMSLKTVELQVAIPRTQEVSRTQDQLQHRLAHGQQVIIEEQKRIDERNRTRPEDLRETAKGSIKQQQEQSQKKDQNSQEQEPKESKQAAESGMVKHHSAYVDPLRGRHVDISL